LEERGAGPGKRGTKLQGREGSTESLTRLGVGSDSGSDREEQEEKTTLCVNRKHTTPCRRQHSAACYAGAAERGAGEEERRRDEGTVDGAKEVARTAGGKAAGARVIGG
jgi:hypothetical protein